ncbi:MAG: FkbM family methyltransferase [Flavobacteriales bacterium]
MRSVILFYLRYFPFPYFKGTLAKRVKIIENTPPFVYKNPFGVSYEIHLDQYHMKNIYLYGVAERNTLRHLRRMAQSGMIFLDIGANIGSFSLSLSRKINNGKIIAFEPVSYNVNILKRNIELNKFTNILVEHKGVSNTTGTARIYFGKKKSGASIVNTGMENSEDIELITVDAYLKQHNINRVDMVKIDVEGAEHLVLAGAEQLLNQPEKLVLVMEYMQDNHKNTGKSTSDLFNLLLNKGFRAFLPRPWPFGLKQITKPPGDTYMDNIIFIKESTN